MCTTAYDNDPWAGEDIDHLLLPEKDDDPDWGAYEDDLNRFIDDPLHYL